MTVLEIRISIIPYRNLKIKKYFKRSDYFKILKHFHSKILSYRGEHFNYEELNYQKTATADLIALIAKASIVATVTIVSDATPVYTDATKGDPIVAKPLPQGSKWAVRLSSIPNSN